MWTYEGLPLEEDANEEQEAHEVPTSATIVEEDSGWTDAGAYVEYGCVCVSNP